MINRVKIFLIWIIIVPICSCSQVLQTVNLELTTEDTSKQDEFIVIEKVLTAQEAQNQNRSPFKRIVLQSGRRAEAKSIDEELALKSKFPVEDKLNIYRIGTGDSLTFSRLIQNNRPETRASSNWPDNLKNFNFRLGVGDSLSLTLLKQQNNPISTIVPSADVETSQNLILEQQNDTILESNGRIGSDGSVLLLEVGRLEAKNKTLNELQSEVRNILIRNGQSPRFQLEITQFKSQKAYLTINEISNIIILNDQQTTLKDILTSAGVGFTPGVTTRIRLQRNREEYVLSLRSIYSHKSPNVNIYDNDHIFVEKTSSNIITNISRVGDDGSVVFEGVGKIQARGRTLEELRVEISSLIEKIPGSENTFQIEISEFSSQAALVNISQLPGGVIPITDTPKALDEILTENGLSFDGKSITRINLQRKGETYTFTLDDLLDSEAPRIYLQGNDRITTETLPYKENKVFILGGVNPQIFKINPENRETLADVLFTSGGPLSSSNAKRSEIYLLRGANPVTAYHLDAQNPARLIVADAMELRPNDIIYVAEQPIISFNRTLATIVPLRILLRDIQDENIP